MGCDIHLFVEKKNADGKWECVKGPNPRIERYRRLAQTWHERAANGGTDSSSAEECRERAEQCDSKVLHYSIGTLERHIADAKQWAAEHDYEPEPDEELKREFERYEGPEIYEDWIWDGRNYDLFAILADVRNGRGFAGFYTGEGFVPIADPRGLPDDVTDYVKNESDIWGSDGHSHSWHTVRQLLGYDWNKTTLHAGEDKRETYAECVGSFYTKSLPRLTGMTNCDLDSVRIVFWFDN